MSASEAEGSGESRHESPILSPGSALFFEAVERLLDVFE